MSGNDTHKDAAPDYGLPDLERDTAETPTGSVNNSTRTKIIAVAFLVAVLAGVGLAVKFLLSTPPQTNDPGSTAPSTAAPVAKDGADADMPVGNPLSASPEAITKSTIPPFSMPQALDGRLARIEDDLELALADRKRLQETLSTISRDLQARMNELETALSAQSTKLADLPPPANNAGEVLSTIEARLKQLDTKLARLDRRSQDNWKQLHGEAGARRRGASLPFSVTAIDWWDDQLSVAVRSGAQARFLAPGDSVAGWRLVSADPATGQARFIRNGREASAQVVR